MKTQENTPKIQRYKGIQIKLHWLTLLLVIATYTTMLISDFFPGPIRQMLQNAHFNLGVMVWMVVFCRLILRFFFKAPPINPPLSRMQHIASKGMHDLIYLLFLSQPILGVLIRAYNGQAWTFLGLPITPFVGLNEDFSFTLQNIHVIIATTGYFLIGGHAAAALFHHYVRRDDTLLRMMPERKASKK